MTKLKTVNILYGKTKYLYFSNEVKMIISSEEIKKLQAKELEIFKEFIAVCEKMNIKYYLLGGTMLGAVRHKGFIPWDDDIDVGMLREDYEKFISEAHNHFPEHLFVQSYKSENNFFYGYSKVRDLNTAYMETALMGKGFNMGLFVDVFPLDYYEYDNHKRFMLKKSILDERMISDLIPFKNRPIKAKVLRIISKIMYGTSREAFAERENLFKSYKKGYYLANHSGAWGEKEIVPAEWYAEGIFLEFEGIKVRAPKEYDKWLTQVYGDYMKLPPPEKRVTHHRVEIIDTENSYKKYL